MDLEGKVVLVSGATSGIGAACARHFGAAGAHVVVAGRDRKRGRSVADAVERAGGAATLLTGDLREPAVCARLVSDTVEALGRLDVLVNNAGVIHRASVDETSDQQWRETMAVNLDAVFQLSRAAVPVMKGQGGGAIVNVASDWALVGGPRAAAYCASKGAVLQLTRAMAVDHARDGIRVNVVCPGDTDTPMLEAEFRQRGLDREAGLGEAAAEIPLGRVATADDVARAVLFLASDAAAFITGAALPVDGGNTAA